MKNYSNALVALLKGVVYSRNEKTWDEIINPQNTKDIQNYFADINLDVIVDKEEGFAYLKQKTNDDEEEHKKEEHKISNLIEKRQLDFHVSLLCLLLRKHLIENDREGEQKQAILSRKDILKELKPFYGETTNEPKQAKKIETAINKLVKEGFLRKMNTEEEQYEINRIIKAFVNADIIQDYLEKLQIYANQTIK
jgi:hypothetical protein